MTISHTPLSGLLLLTPTMYPDDRGWFVESYNQDTLRESGIDTVFVQDNHSYSRAGVLRGLHFQYPPKPVVKLVRCTRGRIWDVAVDLRSNSTTYKQWYGVELSPQNHQMLLVPAGFGHGFYAFEESEVQYKCSTTYDPAVDGGVLWNDPELAIEWPVASDVIVSDKDQHLPPLSQLTIVW